MDTTEERRIVEEELAKLESKIDLVLAVVEAAEALDAAYENDLGMVEAQEAVFAALDAWHTGGRE